MKVLAVCIDKGTLAYMRESGANVEHLKSVNDPDEIMDYLILGEYDCCVIDIVGSRTGIFLPKVLRRKGYKIALIGIGHSQVSYHVKWSETRAEFLESGGDDLISYPANPRELMASMRASVRRFKTGLTDVKIFKGETNHGSVEIRADEGTRRIFLDNNPLDLTDKESKIMILLMSHSDIVFSKEKILSDLYPNENDEAEVKIVDVFVCKIRKKLNNSYPGAGAFVETIWGRGYKINSGFKPSKLAV